MTGGWTGDRVIYESNWLHWCRATRSTYENTQDQKSSGQWGYFGPTATSCLHQCRNDAHDAGGLMGQLFFVFEVWQKTMTCSMGESCRRR